MARSAVWGLSLTVAAPLLITPAISIAQEGADEGAIEEVIVTGTRREGVSPTETLSPVDIIGGATLVNQATFDLTDSITRIAPSLNTQRFPIADGTAVIRPVTLRNLSPDQTLVLINGSRRHRSALVNLQASPLGTVNAGAQAVDFGMIPSLAVKRIEILRDGASAQYGSDAIAGVINVILNDANEGITVSAQTGEYFEGDGARTTIAANGGFSLGDNGFLNLTIEHSTADRTSRGVVRGDCPRVIAVVGVDGVPLDGLCQRWGDPDVETLKGFLNFGIDISDSTELFGYASFGDNEFRSDFFYRPAYIPGVAGTSGSLIVDDNEDGIPDDAPQMLIDDINGAGLNPSDYLTADGTSPSGFVLLNPIQSQFPGGFNPDFGADISDFAVLLGVRGETNRRGIQVLLALAINKKQHGTWPEALNATKLEKSILTDPLSGKTFVYRVNGAEMKLYSIGEDGVDNGATQRQTRYRGTKGEDLVIWPIAQGR
ncbi:MAG: TonB-dependent receptor plug domain-containing protein [Proteobacteria bacterium]|nr:TonB-dependent receptor plug domain-containing protein [Pseudomonadota bacterium]